MTKIALVSDLHLEFGNPLKQCITNADILVVAGDLDVGPNKIFQALSYLAKHYKHVVYTPGNHEYYGTSIQAFNATLLALTKDTNIHVLLDSCVNLEGISFVGAPLWTNFRYNPMAMMAARAMISDFRHIKGSHSALFTPEESAQMHQTSIKYIQSALAVLKGPRVVVTHFLPAKECIHPKYDNENLINHYFSNDYTDLIDSLEDTTWLFGHTHDHIDVTINTTRLVANPHGYDKREYKPFILEFHKDAQAEQA